MSVLIIGSGVFGVSTALQLKRDYPTLAITILDRSPTLPAPDAASTDINKIIRADYGKDLFLTKLAYEAMQEWKRWDAQVPSLFHNTKALFLTRLEEMNAIELDNIKSLQSIGRGDDVELFTGEDSRQKFVKDHPAFEYAMNKAYKGGYINKAAGYISSSKGMELNIKMAKKLGIKFITGSAGHFKKFHYENEIITAAETMDGSVYKANVFVVAAGAWISHIVPQLKECIVATGHPVIHIKVPPHLVEKYSSPKMMVFLADISKTGFYGFPICENVLKFSNHGPGYTNHINNISTPKTIYDDSNQQIPLESLLAYRKFLRNLFPDLADAEIVKTRMCWYADSFDFDFFITRLPGGNAKNLVIAGGGSGHALKFLPVLGKLVKPVVIEALKDALTDVSFENVIGKKKNDVPNECLERFAWRHPLASSDLLGKPKESTRLEETDKKTELGSVVEAGVNDLSGQHLRHKI